MGNLAKFLVGAFGGIVAFFAQYVTKKTALGLTMISVIAGLTLTLYTGLSLMVASLAVQIVNPYILMGMSVLWPPNAEACISAMFATDLAVWLYRTHVGNIKAMAYIT
jgi:hypothetical protein